MMGAAKLSLADKNRAKIWKWAALALRDAACAGAFPLPFIDDETGRQSILFVRGREAILLLAARDEQIAVLCPSGDGESFGESVSDRELRTAEMMPRILAAVAPARRPAPNADERVARVFSVLAHMAASTGAKVVTRDGEWVIEQLSLSPSGIARHEAGAFAVVCSDAGAQADAEELERFATGDMHPRSILGAQTTLPRPAGVVPFDSHVLSMPDGSVVFSGTPILRWVPGDGVRQVATTGEVVACWTPAGTTHSWLLLEDGVVVSLVDGSTSKPLPPGARFVAARAVVAWTPGGDQMWLTKPDVAEPRDIVSCSRAVGAAPESEDWKGIRRFLLDDGEKLLATYEYKGAEFVELDASGRSAAAWGAGIASGYGRGRLYRQRGRWFAIVKSCGVVLIDRQENKRWVSPREQDILFAQTRVAFSPRGDFLLVLGDDTLYAVTLDDLALRRLVRAPDVKDIIEYPNGFCLVSEATCALVPADAIEPVVHGAEVVQWMVRERCDGSE